MAERNIKNETKLQKLIKKICNRYNILSGIFVIISIFFILQLANLQIVKGEEYEKEATRRILSTRVIKAPRGNILDRNGVPIATNEKAFTVMVLNTGLAADELNKMLLDVYKILKSNNDDVDRSLSNYFTIKPFKFQRMLDWIKKPEDLRARVNHQIGLSIKEGVKITPKLIFNELKARYKIDEKYNDSDAYTIMCMRYESRFFNSTSPAIIATDISLKSVAELEELQHRFKGISTDTIPVRRYHDAKYISHVLGYYRTNDSAGVESSMDKYLKGKDGRSRIEVNENGQLVERLDADPAIPGNDVILTIDMNLQKAATKSLEKLIKDIKYGRNGKVDRYNRRDVDSGSVVVMNPNNGEVLAMANYPSYDPDAFIAPPGDKKAQKQISKWLNDNKYPLLNRAISASYAPGSSYKGIVGVAGLEEGLISPGNSTIYDPYVVYYDGVKRTCLSGGHGYLDLQRGLETSCNVYFYELGVKIGIDRLDKWAKALGLGEKSGIDLPGEIAGERSNRVTKEKYYGQTEGPWGELNTALTAIGQYLNRFTPLQMVRSTSAIANGGDLVSPHVVQKVINERGKAVMTPKAKVKDLGTKSSTMEQVKQGLKRVIKSGTAARAFYSYKYHDKYPAAGKTGTAQTTSNHSDSAAFLCFAPVDKPEIAVFVYINRGVWGSWAADVAKDVLNAYFDQKTSTGGHIQGFDYGPKYKK